MPFKKTTRKLLWRELFWRRPIVIVGILVLFISTADWLWDEIILPRFNWERPKLLAIIGWLPWFGWVIIGLLLAIFLIHEHAYALIRKAEDDRDEAIAEKENREAPSNPCLAPRSYKGDGGQWGLTVTNSGYAAYDVHIPSAPIGESGYSLQFEGFFSQVLHKDEAFFATWLNATNLPGCDGGRLYEIMRIHHVHEIKFGIISKDGAAKPHWTRENCKIIRDNQRHPKGLILTRIDQEIISKPPDA